MKQEELCCFNMKFVRPIYPREARLAHTEGVAKLIIIIADDNSIADIQAVSGDSLLLDSSLEAVRQWRIYSSVAKLPGKPIEIEVPLSFTFRIEDAPKPAYLHLVNGKVIRADAVREFTNGIEYSVCQYTHRISADVVTAVNSCKRPRAIPLKEGDCVPSGGPSFDVIAMPLLPVNDTGRAGGLTPR